jgi:hypothetical protein
VGKVFADDVAAGGAKDIADKEDIHWKSLHGRGRGCGCVWNCTEKSWRECEGVAALTLWLC